MLFDKTALKYEGFKLAIGDDILKVLNILNHSTDLLSVVILRTEVLADAVFQLLCLTDVDDITAFVLHYINTGLKGQSHSLLPKPF